MPLMQNGTIKAQDLGTRGYRTHSEDFGSGYQAKEKLIDENESLVPNSFVFCNNQNHLHN